MTVFGTVLLSSGSLVDLDATLFIQLAVFLFMLLVLRKLLFQPVIRLVEARREATDGALETARELREEADRLNGEFSSKLEEVRAFVKVDREQIVDEARARERAIIGKARDEAHELLMEMRDETEKRAKEIRAELEGQVTQLATLVASKVLDRKL